jgi:hypothetical protein
LSSTRRLWSLWLLVAFAPFVRADETSTAAKKPAASPSSAPAKPAVTAADDDLLEFLGSVGEESDGEWIDYLSKTDISKAAKAKNKAPAADTTNTSSK